MYYQKTGNTSSGSGQQGMPGGDMQMPGGGNFDMGSGGNFPKQGSMGAGQGGPPSM